MKQKAGREFFLDGERLPHAGLWWGADRRDGSADGMIARINDPKQISSDGFANCGAAGGTTWHRWTLSAYANWGSPLMKRKARVPKNR